jgi:hypothetical protein
VTGSDVKTRRDPSHVIGSDQEPKVTSVTGPEVTKIFNTFINLER